MHGVCSVCGGSESEGLLRCTSRCQVVVHARCYADERAIVSSGEPWECQSCAVTKKQALRTCSLCPPRPFAGPLWRVRDPNAQFIKGGQWAHVFCAIWFPEMNLVRAPNGAVESTTVAGAERFGHVCDICGDVQGATLRCTHGSCNVYMHASCALEAERTLTLRVDEQSGAVRVAAYCSQHVPAATPRRGRPRLVRVVARQVQPRPATIFTWAQLAAVLPGRLAEERSGVVRYWMDRRCALSADGQRPLLSSLQLLYEGSFLTRLPQREREDAAKAAARMTVAQALALRMIFVK